MMAYGAVRLCEYKKLRAMGEYKREGKNEREGEDI